ncbi:MAG: ATP-binding protein, partial [Thermodesulfobacteriota bacterium]
RYDPDSLVGKNEAARHSFQQAKAGGAGIYLGSRYGNGRRGIYLSYPVTGAGTILGVVVIRYPVAIFEERFAKVDGSMALLDPEGIVFAANKPELVGKSLSAVPMPLRRVFGLVSLSSQPPAPDPKGGGEWLTSRQNGRRLIGMRVVLGRLPGWQLVYLHDVGHIDRRALYGILTPTGYALMAMLLVIVVSSFLLYRKARQASRQMAVAEGGLLRANAVLNQIFNASADAISIIDKNFVIVQANKTFAAMAGKELSEIVRHKCHEIFPSAHCGTPECPKVQIMDQGRKRVVQEEVKRNQAGRKFSCLVMAVPFVDTEGRVVGVLESARDISERVAAEAQLENAFAEAHQLAEEVAAGRDMVQRQKAELEKAYHELQESQSQLLQREKMASIGQLAAGVAHEINNPMGFISSNLGTMGRYLERLAEFLALQGEAVESCCGKTSETATDLAARRKKLKIDYILNDVGSLLRESLDGAERVRKIVQGLKSFSRIDQAQVQAADLNECLDSTINIVWNELKYKAEVKKEYGELPPTVCNPQQLNQVFMNLLVNAAQAIEKHGIITVKSWADPEWISVSVSDTGCGIPREKLSRVFEPFYTTKEVGKGTGLGLSIAYDIVVKKHQGTIEVESEEGKGTTFVVKIPLVAKGNSAN